MTRGYGPDVLRSLLASGAITPEDLLAALSGPQPPCPTHSEYLEVVLRRCPPRSLTTYRTTFRRLVAAFPTTSLQAPTAEDIAAMARTIRVQAATGRGAGLGAERGFLHGARFWYRCAVEDGYRTDNPASSVPMPHRERRVRRALEENELQQVYEAVVATSTDPLLDILLLDFHRETAARRAGAINLRLTDLNPERGSVLLREKGGHEREVPISEDLLDRIIQHGTERRVQSGAAIGYRTGDPLTRRRYNTLFEGVQSKLPWASRLGVSIHWLRHTTLTDVARATNSRIAAAYAGHYDRTVTDLYTTPTYEDLVIAHNLVFPDFPCRFRG